MSVAISPVSHYLNVSRNSNFVENAARLQGYPENQAFINPAYVKSDEFYDKGVREITMINGKKFYFESSVAEQASSQYGKAPENEEPDSDIMYMQLGSNGWTITTVNGQERQTDKNEVGKIINYTA